MNIYIEIDKGHQEDIIVKNYKSNLFIMREQFKNQVIDFSLISKLKGDKEILEKSFQNQKAESLNL
jgi:hypothetical protein